MAVGTDGNLYGINDAGGADGNGTFFRITPAGSLTVLFGFSDSESPYVTLVAGSDGNLYGTGPLSGDSRAASGKIEVFGPKGAGVAIFQAGE